MRASIRVYIKFDKQLWLERWVMLTSGKTLCADIIMRGAFAFKMPQMYFYLEPQHPLQSVCTTRHWQGIQRTLLDLH